MEQTPDPATHRQPTHRRTAPGAVVTDVTAADSIEDELAAQPSIVAEPSPPERRRRFGAAALIAAALLAILGVVYVSNLGQDVQTERDQTGAQLSQVAQATVAACRDGVIVPAPSGITACAEAIKATPGPVDPASVAALVRSIIGVTDPTARFNPAVIAAQLADLLPGLPGQVVSTVVDAQVAAAQGSVRPGDAQAVTEGAVAPLPGPGAAAPVPSGAPGPGGTPDDESDRPDDAPPVDPRDDDPAPTVEPTIEPTVEPAPEPTTEPTEQRPEPTATSIEFARDGEGRCTAVTRYDDGSSVATPADEQSCTANPTPTPTDQGSTPTDEGSASTSADADPTTPDTDGPLIRVN